MYRKQRSHKNDYASCMGRRYGKSRRHQIRDRKQTNLSIAERNYRKNLWNSQRTAWFSLYTMHRKSTDGNESRAHFCMHEFEKIAKILELRNKIEASISGIFRNEAKYRLYNKKWCWE